MVFMSENNIKKRGNQVVSLGEFKAEFTGEQAAQGEEELVVAHSALSTYLW